MAHRSQVFKDIPAFNSCAPLNIGDNFELGKSDHIAYISSLLGGTCSQISSPSEVELLGLGTMSQGLLKASRRAWVSTPLRPLSQWS